MTEPVDPIPASVLALLRHRWKLPDGYSAFESVFTRNERGRQTDPSYYMIAKGKEVEDTDWDCMSHREAVALVREGVFGETAEDQGSRVAINEHAEHAMQDFCREVYGAWAKYRDRLQQVERACPISHSRRRDGS